MKKISHDTKLMTTLRVAYSGLFLALALIVSLLESLLPPLVPAMPFAKIGLCNVILLMCFLLVGVWEGYIVLVLKCILAALYAGNFSMLIWSLPAALAAYTVMVLLHRTRIFSTAGLSVAGGMVHNFTQIAVGAIVAGSAVFAYLPYMLLAGGLAGLFTGVLCHFVVETFRGRMPKEFRRRGRDYLLTLGDVYTREERSQSTAQDNTQGNAKDNAQDDE